MLTTHRGANAPDELLRISETGSFGEEIAAKELYEFRRFIAPDDAPVSTLAAGSVSLERGQIIDVSRAGSAGRSLPAKVFFFLRQFRDGKRILNFKLPVKVTANGTMKPKQKAFEGTEMRPGDELVWLLKFKGGG